MTFAAPGWLVAGVLAVGAVVAIHFIAWRQPRPSPFPTARFVPDESRRPAARTLRLADVLLLALRAAAVVAIGVALARPTAEPDRSGQARVVLVERMGAGAGGAVIDSLRAQLTGNATTVVVLFDSATTAVSDPDDAIAQLAGGSRGAPSLTTALVAGIREARRLSRTHDSVSLTIVASFAEGMFDAATLRVRALWSDSVRLVRVRTAPSTRVVQRLDVRATGDDPVAAAARLAAARGHLRGAIRLVRTPPTDADLEWAAEGNLLVSWPADASAIEVPDAVQAYGATAIGHVARTASGDSGQVIGRFRDGTPAAREVASGAGCVRTVGFDVSGRGDFVLRPAFQRVMAALLSPCGGPLAGEVVSPERLALFAAPPANGGGASIASQPEAWPRWSRILLAAAVTLLLAEMALRRLPSRVAA